ncbi:MAG TPA: nuclear transport factor 2 family protein [Sphingomonadaceae bacterium]|nr:nuclear transport factor 2 family protein [Sphingomonadaceae bacterium]
MTLEEEVAALRREVAELRGQAQAASDYIAISNLQRSYGYYVDKGLWNEAADLFAEDGTLEIAGRGVYQGRERVRAYLHKLPPFQRGQLFNHMQLQPVIHIDPDGLSAKARWRTFIQLATLDVEARWGEATYENRYVKRDGVWMIATLHGYITFYSEYDRGWDKGGIKLLRSIDGLQPDAPPTESYEAWPEVFIPPFHYANPVTGKAR